MVPVRSVTLVKNTVISLLSNTDHIQHIEEYVKGQKDKVMKEGWD